jgi:hypothetical protein
MSCNYRSQVLFASLSCLLACVSCLSGCSSGYELETAPARGTVMLDGKPISVGGVLFTPSKGRGASGPLAADGTFTLGTYSQSDGAIVGKHKVAVLQPREVESGPSHPPGFVAIPSKYQNSESSGLEVEVKANEENVFDLRLSSVPGQ